MTFWLITKRGLGRATQGGPGAPEYAPLHLTLGGAQACQMGKVAQRGCLDMSGLVLVLRKSVCPYETSRSTETWAHWLAQRSP